MLTVGVGLSTGSKQQYTIYKHTCPNGKVYIGITRQNPHHRWRNGHGYDSQLFGKAIKKYGKENIKHEILCIVYSEEEALQKEIEYIAQYRATDRRYGYNVDTGGKGTWARTTISKDTRTKLSEKAKQEWENPDVRNVLVEHLRSINKEKSQCVKCYSKDGKLIGKYKSIREASRMTGIPYTTIWEACNGKQRSCKGFRWRLAIDHTKTEGTVQTQREGNLSKNTNGGIRNED